MDCQNPSLFPDLQEAAPRRTAGGPFASVAIERSLDRVLDYSIPPALVSSVQVGQRVTVPLGRGNKPAHGYVVEIHPTTSTTAHVKPIYEIDDARVLLSPPLMELSRWMSRYYCSPLGTVLESIIPSAVKKKVGLEYTPMVRLAADRERVQAILEKTKAPKRRAVLARLLQLGQEEAVDLMRLASEAGVAPPSVRKLVKLGLITITPEPDFDLPAIDSPIRINEDATAPALNEDQQRVFDELRPRISEGGFSVNLVHGVTGSGKTEVYLRCIREAVLQGKRAIVMVPEIALTPQTVTRFTQRFPRVAVLHSGLAASARHRFWQQVAQGQADVVVGARSAVFAPVPDLGVIVVDEEHEPSYKQDTAPRYHGRDVAIKRAQIEGVPVILGSATPSMETWWRVGGGKGSDGATERRSDEGGEERHEGEGRNAGNGGTQNPGLRTQNSEGTASRLGAGRLAGCYHLLSLPRRVRGLQLPQVELVDMKQEARLRRDGVHLLSQRLEHLLRTTIESGQQAILLLNRRGYANFIYCPSCTHLMQCKYCDVTLTYHRSAGVKAKGATFAEGIHTGQLHCHYCLAVNPLPEKCPDCGKKLSLFGLGTQRVEEELIKKFPDLKFVRVDSDSMHSARDYEAILGQFARGEVQVMLGTQMIAKGLDFPNVTLVGVISGDTALALPDFRSAERTFQLITQVAGRAGRGDVPGRVVLQTFLPDDPTIQAALKQDYLRFAQSELRSRAEVGLPPVARMVRVILRDEDLDKLHERSERIGAAVLAAASRLNNAAGDSQARVTVKGPMPCAINRIAGYHRFQILMFSPSPGALQRVLAEVRQQGGFSESDRVAVDVDPVSLL